MAGGQVHRLARRARVGRTLVVLAMTAGCASETPAPAPDTPPGPPEQLVAVSPTTAHGPVGTTLAQPVVVRVVDANGRGVPNVPVRWLREGGTAQITPPEAVTDARGQTSVTWTLGQSAGPQRVVAVATTTSGPDSVVFTGQASPGPAARVSLSAPARAVAVDDSIATSVTVADAFGNRITDPAPSLSSSDPTVLRVESGGLLRGLRAGTSHAVGRAESAADSVRVRVYRPFRAHAVASGVRNACAIAAADGRAYCWGSDLAADTGYLAMPRLVSGSPVLRSLTVGFRHACGLTATGEAWCWGSNVSGQLGDGTLVSSTAAVRAAGDLRFTTLTAGGEHTCGLDAGGRGYCWGRNSFGELGDGTTVARQASPVTVVPPTYLPGGAAPSPATPLALSAISAGATHTCAIARTAAAPEPAVGTLLCWGAGGSWLGLGASVPRGAPVPTPRAVNGTLAFAAISAGSELSCAIDADARVHCWGTLLGADVPKRVFPDLPFAQVSAGGVLLACALAVGGDAYCQGSNTTLELGPNPPAPQPDPALRILGSGFTAISAGRAFDRNHACALAAGIVRCWGSNSHGQTGQYAPDEPTSACVRDRCVARPTAVQEP